MFKQIRVPKKSANLNCNKKTNNLELLSKYKIEELILPHLSIGKRGFKTKFDLIKVVQLIIKRLKTGCQWRELSLKEYFLDQK